MGNHCKRDGKIKPAPVRTLLEPCDWCHAIASEPCKVGVSHVEYYCPAPHCNQKHQKAADALSCTMHPVYAATEKE